MSYDYFSPPLVHACDDDDPVPLSCAYFCLPYPLIDDNDDVMERLTGYDAGGCGDVWIANPFDRRSFR